MRKYFFLYAIRQKLKTLLCISLMIPLFLNFKPYKNNCINVIAPLVKISATCCNYDLQIKIKQISVENLMSEIHQQINSYISKYDRQFIAITKKCVVQHKRAPCRYFARFLIILINTIIIKSSQNTLIFFLIFELFFSVPFTLIFYLLFK